MPAELNLQHIDIPPNTVLSDLDKAYAVLNYPRLKVNPKASEWTISHALDIAGVSATYRDQILKSKDPLEIRQLFQIWNAGERSKFTGEGTNGGKVVDNGDPNGGTVSTPPPTVPASGPAGASDTRSLADRVDAILKNAKVPPATVDIVHAAITKEIMLISNDVARRILAS